MGIETERKFLVKNDSWRKLATDSARIFQTYLNASPGATVRLRIASSSEGEKAWITVKSPNRGAVRGEWEYPIPPEDARQMAEQCTTTGLIDKTRHHIGRWEIDEFHGSLSPLVLAEIELGSPDEAVELPGWVGKEVTGDPAYANSTLSQHLQ